MHIIAENSLHTSNSWIWKIKTKTPVVQWCGFAIEMNVQSAQDMLDYIQYNDGVFIQWIVLSLVHLRANRKKLVPIHVNKNGVSLSLTRSFFVCFGVLDAAAAAAAAVSYTDSFYAKQKFFASDTGAKRNQLFHNFT